MGRALPNGHRRAAAQPQSFGRTLLRASDFNDAKGVHERKIFARPGVSIGSGQAEGVIAGVHLWRGETLEQRAIDVGNQITEMVDADYYAGDEVRFHGGLIHPCRHQCFHPFAEVCRHAAAGRQFRRERRKNIPPMEGGADFENAQPGKTRTVELHDDRIRIAGHNRRQQAVIGGEKDMSGSGDRKDIPRSPHAGVDYSDMYGASRKISERARQPEPRFRRPVDNDLMRQIHNARRGKAAQNDAFHDPDEGAFVSEVGGYGDDARRRNGRAHE